MTKSKSARKNIVVMGMWHLGLVYSASLAKQGANVIGFDFKKDVIKKINQGDLPIFEPGLAEIISECKDHLSFTSDEKVITTADYVFIAYDLDVDHRDIAQTEILKKIFKIVASRVSENTAIIISSQVPVGSSRVLVNLLKKRGITQPKVVYFPENLRLGNAFEGFLNPDRIILGSDNNEIAESFKKDFPFTCPIISMGLESAEMVKHALNCYLATCISLSSELSDLSEKSGADMRDVVKALKLDKRVSAYAPINPGLGFAGGTLGRDIQSLKIISKKVHYTPVFLDAVYKVNQQRIPTLVSRVQASLGTLKNKRIGLLGLTYKANTNTLRRSMSLDLALLLKKKGAHIAAYDPAVTKTVSEAKYISVKQTAEELFDSLDAVIFMTEWKEILNLDIVALSRSMKNKVFFDTKNAFDAEVCRAAEIAYYGIGIQ